MSKKSIFKFVALTVIIFLFNSCKKEAGEGGNSSIRGKVWVINYNSTFTSINGEYVGADEYVYIIYGSDVSYGDRTKTNPEGEFEFKYLREGSYTVYVYSKDKTQVSPSGQVAVKLSTSISKEEQVVDLGTITIYN
ncbi:MAG: hypothetical protein HYU68_00150 [Bacteroidetes bacterium]|nr:hypothetical protein [Bacteroidota bacterium]